MKTPPSINLSDPNLTVTQLLEFAAANGHTLTLDGILKGSGLHYSLVVGVAHPGFEYAVLGLREHAQRVRLLGARETVVSPTEPAPEPEYREEHDTDEEPLPEDPPEDTEPGTGAS